MKKGHRIMIGATVTGPKNNQKRIPVYRKVHRNDPCPCGQEEILVFKAADGSIIKEHIRPRKFKKCCLEPK